MRSRGNLVRKTIAPRGHHIFAIFPPAFLCYLYLGLHKLSPWRFPMGLGCSRGIPSISEPSLHLLPMGGMQTAPPAAAVPESPQNHSSSQKSKSLLPNTRPSQASWPCFRCFYSPHCHPPVLFCLQSSPALLLQLKAPPHRQNYLFQVVLVLGNYLRRCLLF